MNTSDTTTLFGINEDNYTRDKIPHIQ